MEDIRVYWWLFDSGERIRSDVPEQFQEIAPDNSFEILHFNEAIIRHVSLNDSANELLISSSHIARVHIENETPISAHDYRIAQFLDDELWLSTTRVHSTTSLPPRFAIHLSSNQQIIHDIIPAPNDEHLLLLSPYQELNTENVFQTTGHPWLREFSVLIVRAGAFSYDGSQMLITGNSGVVLRARIDGDQYEVIQQYSGHTSSLNDVLYINNSPNAPKILNSVGGYFDDTFRRWNIDTHEMIPAIEPFEQSSNFPSYIQYAIARQAVFGPHFLHKQMYMVGIPYFGWLGFHDTNLKRVGFTVLEHNRSVDEPFGQFTAIHSIRNSADPSVLEQTQLTLGDGFGNLLLIHDGQGNESSILHRQSELHRHRITSVAPSMDDRLIISSDQTGRISVWDWQQNLIEGVIQPQYGTIESLAVHPDNTCFAAAGHNGTRIYDMASFEQRWEFLGHDGFVNDVAFSPDGTLLATASQDGTILLWNPETGDVVTRLNGHICEVNAIAFSPDGTQLTSVGNDGTARVWDLEEHTAVDDWLQHSRE